MSDEPIPQTKRMARIIDATEEPYREWHAPDVKPLLKPECQFVGEWPMTKVSRLKREHTIALRREAYPDDITEIQAAIIHAGFDCSRLQAADLWRLYSDSLCAGWLGIEAGATADGLFACVEPFIEPEDE